MIITQVDWIWIAIITLEVGIQIIVVNKLARMLKNTKRTKV